MAKGSKRMIPINGPRPGMAPTTSPTMIPANVRPKASGDRKTSESGECEAAKAIRLAAEDVQLAVKAVQLVAEAVQLAAKAINLSVDAIRILAQL